MKKTITILSTIIIIFGCSKEDNNQSPPTPVVTTCNVRKYLEIRQIIFATATQPQTDTGWFENGASNPYSTNCEDCGKILPGGSTSSITGGTSEIRYIAKCK